MELEFEIPFRELGFSGVPHRTASNVMPTVNCLVRPPLWLKRAHPAVDMRAVCGNAPDLTLLLFLNVPGPSI